MNVAASADPSLRFSDVSLTFPDGTQALRDVTFSVHRGEFVSLVGPSGCGKSTILRVAARLVSPTAGEYSIDEGTLGYVFQDSTLLPWRTVERNIGLLAELHGIARHDASARVAEVISLVGLDGFEKKYPRQLSGGMRMRASLARSLVLSPRNFLFDEPFGSLDEITRERLNSELCGLYVDQQFSSLFVTHSVAEAVYLSSRVLVMSSRPGTIVGDFQVPFPFPRSEDVRFSPEFAGLCGDISRSLREHS